MSNKPAQSSPRERLLAAADALFYEEGVRTVGIDRVIEKAGVAKASLYSTFGSKDELVRAYLSERHARWGARVDEELAKRKGGPREKLLAVFDILGDLFAEPSFRGCAFLNASAEAAPGGAIQQVTSNFRRWVHDLFLGLCKKAGLGRPAALAQKLVLLYDGASVKAQLDHDPAAARTAREIAALVIDAALAAQ